VLEINIDRVYSLSQDHFLYKIKELEKYWVFNIDSGEHYTLNETSFWILDQIDGLSPLNAVLEKFIEAFDVDREQGENDFIGILRGFLEEGIIRNGG
jgi:hypothetical protein